MWLSNDSFNLDQEITRQLPSLNRGPGRLRVGQHTTVHGIHGSKVIHVGEEHRGLDCILPRCTSLFKDKRNVINNSGLRLCLARLLQGQISIITHHLSLDSFRDGSVDGRNSAACINQILGSHATGWVVLALESSI